MQDVTNAAVMACMAMDSAVNGALARHVPNYHSLDDHAIHIFLNRNQELAEEMADLHFELSTDPGLDKDRYVCLIDAL